MHKGELNWFLQQTGHVSYLTRGNEGSVQRFEKGLDRSNGSVHSLENKMLEEWDGGQGSELSGRCGAADASDRLGVLGG